MNQPANRHANMSFQMESQRISPIGRGNTPGRERFAERGDSGQGESVCGLNKKEEIMDISTSVSLAQGYD